MKSLLFFCALTIAGLTSCAEKNTTADNNATGEKTIALAGREDLSKYHQATFAAGCFWCMEAIFESVKGVHEVVSGYAGGHTKNPTYEEVNTETTGYAESINVYYDSSKIDYPTLLKVFFAAQDPGRHP